MELERLAVRLERPPVDNPQVGAAQHLHAPAAQVTDDALIAVSDQLAERSEERGAVPQRPNQSRLFGGSHSCSVPP